MDTLDPLTDALFAKRAEKLYVTLGDVLQAAKSLGLTEDVALLGIERLARTVDWTRFYVDRNGDKPRLVEGQEIRDRILTDAAWAKGVEVVWAAFAVDVLEGRS